MPIIYKFETPIYFSLNITLFFVLKSFWSEPKWSFETISRSKRWSKRSQNFFIRKNVRRSFRNPFNVRFLFFFCVRFFFLSTHFSSLSMFVSYSFSVFVSSSFPHIFLLFLCSLLLLFLCSFLLLFLCSFLLLFLCSFLLLFLCSFLLLFNDSSFFWIFWLSRPSIFFQFRLTGCFWQNNFFWWYTSKIVKVFSFKSILKCLFYLSITFSNYSLSFFHHFIYVRQCLSYLSVFYFFCCRFDRFIDNLVHVIETLFYIFMIHDRDKKMSIKSKKSKPDFHIYQKHFQGFKTISYLKIFYSYQ